MALWAPGFKGLLNNLQLKGSLLFSFSVGKTSGPSAENRYPRGQALLSEFTFSYVVVITLNMLPLARCVYYV